jgi:type II secretion system protein H
MISPTGSKRSRPAAGFPAARAFTLIELLLVMALLTIVISISVPSLSNFFRGRNLDSEARRLLSLTRHGQSRAVSEGIPMVLWVDVENRTYGLEQEPGWDETDGKAVNLKLDENLKVEVTRTNVTRSLLATASPLRNNTATDTRQNLPSIHFLPDGSISEESLPGIRILDKDGASVFLGQSQNRLHYEIRTDSTQ